MSSSISSPIGIAVLGAGIFARNAHLPAIKALPANTQTVLRAIHSRSSKSASTLASQASSELGYTVDYYSEEREEEGGAGKDLATLLERADVQIVIVALPIMSQPEIILKSLIAGKHVLSEKPIGATVKIAKALISEYRESYESKGIHFRIAENFEVEPAFLAARDVIRSGAIGDVAFFRLSMVSYIDEKNNRYYNTAWRTNPEYQGGFLLDGGVHQAALLRTVLPSKPASLSSFASLNREVLAPHDTIHAIVRLAPGPNASSNSKPAHGIFEVSFGAPDPSYSKLPNGTTVTGTEGWLSITNTRKDGQPHIRVEVYENGHEVGSASSVPSQVIEEKNQGVDRELENFVRLVRGEGDAGSGTLDGALSDVAFIEAALHSEGKPVTLI